MTNENCLEGIRCPQCGQEDCFKITALITCNVTDDGSEPVGDHEWISVPGQVPSVTLVLNRREQLNSKNDEGRQDNKEGQCSDDIRIDMSIICTGGMQ